MGVLAIHISGALVLVVLFATGVIVAIAYAAFVGEATHEQRPTGSHVPPRRGRSR